jgi:phenylpropionate dioxygenase-like ring-hydroxylating dioxygenase large terminal subunit
MVTREENELMTRVEGDAPLGKLIRENSWIPFALSDNIVTGEAPTPVRLLGQNYVAWRAPDGRIGFMAEGCPHRQASLLLARVEDSGLRCIYHGWKVDVSGAVVEAPTQVTRHDRFCASVKVDHYPVHEAGNIAWVWLNGIEPAPFPDLPFTEEHGNKTAVTFSSLPVNWLQALEGGLDSVHAGILHQSWTKNVIRDKTETMDEGKATVAFTKIPTYEVGEASFGMRAASLRQQDDDKTYARVTNYFFPLVIVAATGFVDRYHVFAFSPVDDTHHLLFFGSYGTAPVSQKDFGAVRADFDPDPRNFSTVSGDRSNRWGQDRALMDAGHHTGFSRSVVDEDSVVQVSMGPIVDRTKDNLSGSDGAVANARRLILDVLAAYAKGELPPGSARGNGVVRIPNPYDAVLGPDESWRDLQPEA